MNFIQAREKVFREMNRTAYPDPDQSDCDYLGHEYPYVDDENPNMVVVGMLAGLAVSGLAAVSLVAGVAYGGHKLLRRAHNAS